MCGQPHILEAKVHLRQIQHIQAQYTTGFLQSTNQQRHLQRSAVDFQPDIGFTLQGQQVSPCLRNIYGSRACHWALALWQLAYPLTVNHAATGPSVEEHGDFLALDL